MSGKTNIITKSQINSVKKLNKAIGLTKLKSYKQLRKMFRGIIITGVGTTVMASETLREGGLNLLDNAIYCLADMGYSDPVLYFVTISGTLAVPAITGYCALSSVYNFIKAPKTRKKEAEYSAEKLIKKGILSKDKYLNRGIDKLKTSFDGNDISYDQAKRIIYDHAVRHAKDRSTSSGILKKKKFHSEFLALQDAIWEAKLQNDALFNQGSVCEEKTSKNEYVINITQDESKTTEIKNKENNINDEFVIKEIELIK